MITLSDAKKIAHDILYEVTGILNIPNGNLLLMFLPKTGLPIDTLPAVYMRGGCIAISESYLHQCILSGSFSVLRLAIYATAKQHLYFINGTPIDDVSSLEEAFIFAEVTLTLKGEQIIIPRQVNKDFFIREFQNCLKQNYRLNGFLEKASTNNTFGDMYKLRLSEDEERRYLNHFLPRHKRPSTVTRIKEGEKGSLADPFENIDEAVCFIEKMEEQAMKADSLMNDIANMKFCYDTFQHTFRVMWASSYAAHHKNNYPRHSFIVNPMAPLPHSSTRFFSFKPNLCERKFLYRGQMDRYPGIPCVPNLFRSEKHNEKNDYLDFLIFSQEMELLIGSHPLVKLLENGVKLNYDKFSFRMHYSGLAQHYYNKSKFLDLTSDINAAMFFATTKYDRDTDTYSAHDSNGGIGVLYCYELTFPQAYQSYGGHALKTIGKQVFGRSGLQSGYLLEMEQGVDLKKLPEVFPVYFKHNAEIAKRIFKESDCGSKYFQNDLLETAWINRLKVRFENNIVSKAAVELNAKRNNRTFYDIANQLLAKGVTIDCYQPAFTEDELDMYYESIKLGFWEDFCNDIYFYGPDGPLYKDALLNLPNRDEYKWAFFRQ